MFFLKQSFTYSSDLYALRNINIFTFVQELFKAARAAFQTNSLTCSVVDKVSDSLLEELLLQISNQQNKHRKITC